MEYSSDGWLYPSLSILKELQDSKAISYSMLDKCEIREIIVGESSEFEVKQFVDWTITMHDRDDVSLPCSGLSLTIQTVDISLRDIYRIAGLIPLDAPRKILSCELEIREMIVLMIPGRNSQLKYSLEMELLGLQVVLG